MQVQVLSPAPRRCGRHIVRSDFFAKVASHSFCRSSFPNRTRYRWASVWFWGNATSPVSPFAPRRSKVRFAPAYFLPAASKISHPPAPLLLLCAKGHARLACSVASAPAAARCRCHLRSQGHFKIFRRCLFCYLLTCYCGLRILRGGVFLASGGALFSKEHREIEFENIYRTDAAANSETPPVTNPLKAFLHRIFFAARAFSPAAI